jgi:halimadienyl-diphosphate synthase
MSPSSYDIAWMARLRGPDGNPRWPDLIEWLLKNQRTDGSWGGGIEYYHDRIICTLAAIIALQENGYTQQSQEAIRQGEHYLWQHLHLLPRDPFELVGFELILPTLLGEAQALNLDVPAHTCGYGKIQTAKLQMIPPDKLYSSQVSTIYSLEFLGRSVDIEKLQQAQAMNGSWGNSPATTAFYLSLSQTGNQNALAYLERLRNHKKHIITVYPYRTFELGWILNNLIFCGLSPDEFISRDSLDMLQEEIEPDGVGFDSTFTVPDGDTTSVCCRVLLEAGYEVDPAILARFEDQGKRVFRTYEYERNVSVGTNVHALEALELMNNYPHRNEVKDSVVIALLDKRKYNMYWIDKWHASPYYATSHAIAALSKEGDYLAYACRDTIDWLVHTQRDDGSWGFFKQGTAEETAYVLAALLHYNRKASIDQEVLHQGAAYLLGEYQQNKSTFSPELWIAKCLYKPCDIVKSAILSALILYNKTFGRAP